MALWPHNCCLTVCYRCTQSMRNDDLFCVVVVGKLSMSDCWSRPRRAGLIEFVSMFAKFQFCVDFQTPCCCELFVTVVECYAQIITDVANERRVCGRDFGQGQGRGDLCVSRPCCFVVVFAVGLSTSGSSRVTVSGSPASARCQLKAVCLV